MLSRVRDHLGTFTRPQLGQLVIWVLIYIALTKTNRALPVLVGERTSPVTILSFLPEDFLTSWQVFTVCRWVLIVAGISWALQLLLPLSCWLTVVSFTAVVALFNENTSVINHAFNLANIVLIIHAMWYHFHHRAIKESLTKGCFWRTRIYPNWVFYLSLFCIGIFHTYAGLSKLTESGLQWANGVSLQLWLHLFGREDSFFKAWIVSNRHVAIALQGGTLVVETGAILAVFSRRLRVVIGVALLALYFGIIESFGYIFKYNALLVALFFLPVHTALDYIYRKAHQTTKITVHIACGNLSRKVCHFVLSRLDIFGVTRGYCDAKTNTVEGKLTDR